MHIGLLKRIKMVKMNLFYKILYFLKELSRVQTKMTAALNLTHLDTSLCLRPFGYSKAGINIHGRYLKSQPETCSRVWITSATPAQHVSCGWMGLKSFGRKLIYEFARSLHKSMPKQVHGGITWAYEELKCLVF